MLKHRTTNPRRFRRLLDTDHEDPLSGVANLFDIALVFVAALLIAVVTQRSTDASARSSQTESGTDSSSRRIPRRGEELNRFQVGNRTIGGEGQRLGIAYKLPSGEVIYVPEKNELRNE